MSVRGPLEDLLRGGLVGAVLGLLPWLVVGLLAGMFLVGLGACMGMANMMSAVPTTWTDLLTRDLPHLWWDEFGPFLSRLSAVACGLSTLLFGVSVVGFVLFGLLRRRR